jgi:beta-phosphoglucomutase
MPSRNPIDVLIFDFDGVIADTESLYWRSWAEGLEIRGITFTWEQYCEIGRGVHDVRMLENLRQLVGNTASLSGLEQDNVLRKQRMRDLCISQPPIHEKTIEMLHSLKCYRLGLVTSSSSSDVEPVLRAAGIYQCFDAFVFGEDVEHHKPSPDPYLLLGRRMGVTTGLAFEDSDAGIASARLAGFTVVPISEPAELSRIVCRELSSSPLRLPGNRQ